MSSNFFAPNIASGATYVLSDWEKTIYYSGISPDPPEPLYRSDFLENPFPIPTGRYHHRSTKTVYGVFRTPLNTVWGTVAPQIREILKAWKIRYSAIHAARFVTHGSDGNDTLGPIVIWIATQPTTTTAENAHDVSPDILSLLKASGVEGAVIEWYEGVLKKLAGPPLLRVTDGTNSTHYVRRFLTAVLGMPITIAEMEDTDAQGSVAFFFHENKDMGGNPSAKVFGVSNCHVLRENTTVAYEFKGTGAIPQHVRLAGFHRFQRGLDEIKACIGSYGTDADLLTREIVEWEAKPKSKDPEEAAEYKAIIEAKREKLAKVKKDISTLEAFYKDTVSRWGDIARRNIGHVDWAPEISVDVQGRKYTRDIGTSEVDAARFKAQFKGNVIDLGVLYLVFLISPRLIKQREDKFTPWQLTKMFYPQSGGRTTFKFPVNRQLRIKGCVTREFLAVPDCFDGNSEPCLIVMKDGNTTDLTVGRYAGLEAYLCNDLGVESIELAIYNYNWCFGPFSASGDSGSLIFDGEGYMVGVLHSGMLKGGSSYISYATPAWWVIEPSIHTPTSTVTPSKCKHNCRPSALLSSYSFLPSTMPLPFLSAIVLVSWAHPPPPLTAISPPSSLQRLKKRGDDAAYIFSSFFSTVCYLLPRCFRRVSTVDSVFTFVPFFRLILSRR